MVFIPGIGNAGSQNQSRFINGVSHDFVYDDFDGGARGRMGWAGISVNSGNYFENSGNTDGIDSTSLASGIWLISTGTNASGGGGIYTQINAYTGGYQTFELIFRIKIPDLYSAGQPYKIFAGFGDDYTSNSEYTDGAYFLYDGATSGNWICCTSQTATRTRTTSAKAVDSNWTWFKVAISLTDVKFYTAPTFTGTWTLLATHTDNLPFGGSKLFGIAHKIAKTGGITARTFGIDYCSIEKIWSGNR